jgi:ribosomal protein S18 acetylase RimI-like enzyme
MSGSGGAPRVRPATPGDAAAIARIRVDSWRTTYAGMIPATILDRMDVSRNEAWISGLIEEPPPRATLVVEGPDHTVKGYALAAPCRDDDVPGFGEIEAIYLEPAARGSGLGRPLLEAATGTLAGSGFETAVLWVLTANEGARRFYERAGFRPDGSTRDIDFDGTPLEEIRYRRATSA